MKKAISSALCLLAVLSVLSGCSDDKDESTSVVYVQEEMKVSPESIGFEWQKPYLEIIQNFRSSADFTKSNGISGSMFDLYDINSDKIPELIISPSIEKNQQCKIYTISSGKALEIGENGCFGKFTYYTETGSLSHEIEGDGFTIGEFRTISDNTLVTEMSYFNNTALASVGGYDHNSGVMIRYEIDSHEVSLPEYDEAMNKYNDQFNITLGRKYTFSDASIEYALRCSESWGAVLSDDRKEKCVNKLASLVKEYDTNAAFEICDLNGDNMPEIVVSEGDSPEASCRIFYWEDKILSELEFKYGSDGCFFLDREKNVFFTAAQADGRLSASIEDGSAVSISRSDSIIRCGRKYPLFEEYIIEALR